MPNLTRYAQLSNNIVVSVIESETDPDGTNGEWVACSNAGPGWTYDGAVFAPPTPVVEPWANLIDIGPFFDRFGAAKMAVLTSTDAGVKAIIGDAGIRKWIDISRADVAQSVTYIASKVPAVTPAIQAAVISPPVLDSENMALRKLYFS